MNTSEKMLYPMRDIILRLSFDNQFQLQKHPKNEQKLYRRNTRNFEFTTKVDHNILKSLPKSSNV